MSSDYRYDFRGWRTQETVGGVTTNFHWGADDVLEEDGGAADLQTYERFGGIVSAIGAQRVLRDGMGSIVGKWDGAAPVKQHRYSPFGEIRSGSANWTQPSPADSTLAYAGQYADAATKLSYANQRWYAPELGRFLSEDPVGPSPQRLKAGRELDGFGYAAENPTHWLDSDGRACHTSRDGTKDCLSDNKYDQIESQIIAGEHFKNGERAQGIIETIKGQGIYWVGGFVSQLEQWVVEPNNEIIRTNASLKEGRPKDAARHAVGAALATLRIIDLVGMARGSGAHEESETRAVPESKQTATTNTGLDYPANARNYKAGEKLPNGRIAGDGPGAARANSQDFTPTETPSRSAAFRQAKRDSGIPNSQHPDARPEVVPMTTRDGTRIRGADGKDIKTREYTYTRADGSKIVIQEHSAGHQYKGGVGNQGPHFNVRPAGDTRTGKVQGTEGHYPFKDRRHTPEPK